MTSTKSLENPGTRERLISAMLNALRTRGFHGIGLNELLMTAQAPKGVLYHHFPGGKTELAVAAIDHVIYHITQRLASLLDRYDDPVKALAKWMTDAQKMLRESGYEAGCPLATIALESTAEDQTIRQALANGFEAIRSILKAALTAQGLDHTRAENLATLIVSTYEGGLIQARVAGNQKLFQNSIHMLLEVLHMSLTKS